MKEPSSRYKKVLTAPKILLEVDASKACKLLILCVFFHGHLMNLMGISQAGDRVGTVKLSVTHQIVEAHDADGGWLPLAVQHLQH